MKPRLGLPADVDPITEVILKAMPLDPQWDYRFPYRLQYPEDHYHFTRMLFEHFLDPEFDDWVVMVVEDAFEPDEETKIAAFGVFNIAFRKKRRYGPGYQAQDPMALVDERGGRTRRDANRERFDAFGRGQAEAYKRFFEPFGPEQIHLQILATLPEFQGRGHASSICKWAMALAHEESLADISVMASPMGYKLYKWLEFDSVGNFPIQVPGEEEKLTLVAMRASNPDGQS
ncbi:hypothetical protein B0T14DRAFT_136459 [Immersiella caudata]|uniref:N-acetyltransferase domain-containing protein n=1 Tax=Immersiella caudata TaxID=314043 RepID=A0AA39X5F1_9PEZI|nr:hypothetical protein B0T14DRAFT_136459 [Immersiella caudata]